MTLIYSAIAVLIGMSMLATLAVVGRQALRRVLTRRLLKQAQEVRGLLSGMRERNYVGIDKMLFDMRDSYDLTVIEDELRTMLGEEEAEEAGASLRRAFDLVGLTNKYLERVRKASGWQERARAATALGQLGESRAVPLLLEAMRDKREDSDVKLAAAEALGHIRDASIIPVLCEQLGDVDEWASPRLAKVITSFGIDAVPDLLKTLDASPHLNARIWAAQVLGKIGDRKATTALTKRLHDRSEQMRVSVANALGDIGDNRAFRSLVEVILRDPVAAVRSQAATSLGRIGDQGALPLLVASLGDPEYWMRFRALEAIEALAPEDTSPIEGALGDSNPEVRRRAALALERLGALEVAFENLPSADPAKEAEARARLIAVGRAGLSERLARHLDDDNVFMRERIASLLGPVGDPRHAKDLVRRLDDESEEVRFAAIESLGDLGESSSVPALAALLAHSDSMHRTEAVKSLVHFSEPALRQHWELIHSLMERESDEIRLAALQVLAAVDGEDVDALLLEGLKDRYIEVRIFAAGKLGVRKVEAAIADLGLALSDANERMRTEAATALGCIGGDAAIGMLLAAMPNTSGEQRDAICETLAALGFDAVRPLLDVLMASEDMKTRLGAIWTLGKTGDARAIPLLKLFLLEDDTLLRSSAAGALGKIASVDSVDALQVSLRDPSPFVRSASINGLGKVANAAHLHVLEATLRDPDPFVRNRAAIAVGRIGGEEAHRMLRSVPSDSFEPAMRVIAMALTGSATGIGEPLEAMKDPTLRHKVSAALEQEDENVRVIFFANLTPSPGGATASRTIESEVELEPSELLAKFTDAIRNSQDPETRRRAAAALGGMRDESALEALGTALSHDPDAEVRARAAAGLASHSDRSPARSALVRALVDPDVSVRKAAITAAAEFAGADEARPIFESLRAKDASLVACAEEALARIHRGPVERVHDWMMGQERAAMQACGLRILRRIGDARSLGLVSALLRAEVPELRIEAARALAAMQVPDAVEAMLAALGDPIEEVRVGIVEALAGITRRDVLDGLERACLDPSLKVRQALTRSLGTMKSTRALELLLRLVGDSDPRVAGGALWGLVTSPDLEGQHKFIESLADVSADAKRILHKELGADATRGDATPFAERLRTQIKASLDGEVRKLGVQVLAALDALRFASEIAEALDDPDATVRLAAIDALSELEAERVGDWLKELLDDPVEDVRKAARKALFRVL